MQTIREHAVLGNDVVLVLDNVVVPHLNRMSIVNSLVPDGLHLESSALELANIPVEWAGSIGTGEDILSHEVAPDQILVLPGAAEAGNLKEEDSIGLKE